MVPHGRAARVRPCCTATCAQQATQVLILRLRLLLLLLLLLLLQAAGGAGGGAEGGAAAAGGGGGGAAACAAEGRCQGQVRAGAQCMFLFIDGSSSSRLAQRKAHGLTAGQWPPVAVLRAAANCAVFGCGSTRAM
jgi:hypothetical protein